VDIALGGARVVAKVQLPNAQAGHGWMVEGLMHPEVQGPSPGAGPADAEVSSSNPAVAGGLQTGPMSNSYSFFRQPDGSYAADDVDPGVYVVEFYAIDGAALADPASATEAKGSAPAHIGAKMLKAVLGPIRVPGGPGTAGVVDLGGVELR
jgi:hypothetical protein